jgi:hypothetical protein
MGGSRAAMTGFSSHLCRLEGEKFRKFRSFEFGIIVFGNLIYCMETMEWNRAYLFVKESHTTHIKDLRNIG